MHPLLPRLALLSAASAWAAMKVNSIVPLPYLDEAFHIPQAQSYCRNDFSSWDPKLTTPAGLYLLSYPISLLLSLLTSTPCSPAALRSLNAIGVSAVLPMICYRILRIRKHTRESAAQTSINVALFPLLFFFGSLYYTDVYSTVFVLLSYLLLLEGNVWASAGMSWVALWFRQTNILWTVFLLIMHATATLEKVSGPYKSELRIVKKETAVENSKTTAVDKKNDGVTAGKGGDVEEEEVDRPWTINMKGVLAERKRPDDDWDFYEARGMIDQVKIWNIVYGMDIGAKGWLLTYIRFIFYMPVTFLLVAFRHRIVLLPSILPFLAVLTSFVAFIFWNGGIVLGDKSAHQPTIHVTQLFYFCTFTVIMSFPVLLSWPLIERFYAANISIYLLGLTPEPTVSKPATSKKKPNGRKPARSKPISLKSNNNNDNSNVNINTNSSSSSSGREVVITWSYAILTLTLLFLLLIAETVRRNTVLHPYLLADNRHLVFYIFNRTIRANWWARYAAVPIYYGAIWTVYDALRITDDVLPDTPGTTEEEELDEEDRAATTGGGGGGGDKSEVRAKTIPLGETSASAVGGVSMIFVTAYTLAVIGTLIGAGLVEFRYFIIGWVMWRLHLFQPDSSSSVNSAGGAGAGAGTAAGGGGGREGPKWRLYAETLWFIGIDVAVLWMFLYLPFEWAHERGVVQRFMW